MRKNYFLEIDGRMMPLGLEKTGNSMSIALGDKTYEITLDKTGNLVTVGLDGKEYRVSVRKINGREFETEMFGEMHRVAVQDAPAESPPREEAPDSAAQLQEGYFEIKTPIPGTLVSIEVEVGEQVGKGDCVCVVEAMKLYNEIESPFDGVVEEIVAGAGDSLKPGETVVTLGLKR